MRLAFNAFVSFGTACAIALTVRAINAEDSWGEVYYVACIVAGLLVLTRKGGL